MEETPKKQLKIRSDGGRVKDQLRKEIERGRREYENSQPDLFDLDLE